MNQDDILDLVNQLEYEEQDFLDRIFIAPVLPRGSVVALASGLRYVLRVYRVYSPNIYRIQPVNFKTAKIVGTADRTQRELYMRRLPQVNLVLVSAKDDVWYGVQQSVNDNYRIEGLVPMYLVQNGGMFHSVCCRYDGKNFWYDRHDYQRQQYAEELSQNIFQGMTPKQLVGKYLYGEYEAYRYLYDAYLKKLRESKEYRLQQAVEFSGGELVSYVERQSGYTVHMKVNGRKMPPVTVSKDDFTIQSAGFCLSGYDQDFDLTSLVNVWKDGVERNLIYVYGGHDND